MDQVQTFRKALENPIEVSEGDFQLLLSKYPYAQPIIFASERKKQLEQKTVDIQRSLLYAYNAFWLRDYLHKPATEIPELEVQSDDYISYEEIETSLKTVEESPVDITDQDESLDKENDERSETEESFDEETDGSSEPQEPIDESQLFDYEKYALGAKPRKVTLKKETEEELAVEVEQLPEEPAEEISAELTESISDDTVQNAEAAEFDSAQKDDISLYNDELMPYSFRWWLYKTRLEHADTYQPFANPTLPKPQKGQFDAKKLDEAILDQQIRENIFHLQDPEDKLSEEFKKETVEFTPEHGTSQNDEVIDKFIREEPQIQAPKAEEINNENKARKSSEDRLSVVTETLANVYESQAMHEKAIQVFKKLIFQNPEKKSYFATRIKELEQKL